jgi:hypothetical protein
MKLRPRWSQLGGEDMNYNRRKVEFLTRFLIKWHLSIGKQLAAMRLEPQSLNIYLEKINILRELDLINVRNMHQIAIEQVSGAFELFYAESIPDQMWYQMCGEYNIEAEIPPNLGNIGHQILNLLKELQFEKEEDKVVFRLPEGWPDRTITLGPARDEVLLKPNETPRQALRRSFVEMEKLNSFNIGGRELLVSMNEDLPHERELDHIAVYNPASFGFQLISKEDGKDNIVVEAVKGQIRIIDVVLGVEETSDYNE